MKTERRESISDGSSFKYKTLRIQRHNSAFHDGTGASLIAWLLKHFLVLRRDGRQKPHYKSAPLHQSLHVRWPNAP